MHGRAPRYRVTCSAWLLEAMVKEDSACVSALCAERSSGHHFAAHLGNPPYSGRSEAAPRSRESLTQLTVAHSTLIHPGYKFEESQQRLLTD